MLSLFVTENVLLIGVDAGGARAEGD